MMFETFRKLLDLLTPAERRRSYLLVVLIMLEGLVQIVGIASILPFLAVLANPEVIETNAPAERALHLARLREHRTASWCSSASRSSASCSSACCSAPSPTTSSTASSTCAATRSRAGCSRGYLGQPYTWFLEPAQRPARRQHPDRRAARWSSQALMPAMRLISQGVVTRGADRAARRGAAEGGAGARGAARRQLRADLRRRAPPAQPARPGTRTTPNHAALPDRRRRRRRHQGREAPRARGGLLSTASASRRWRSPNRRRRPRRSARCRATCSRRSASAACCSSSSSCSPPGDGDLGSGAADPRRLRLRRPPAVPGAAAGLRLASTALRFARPTLDKLHADLVEARGGAPLPAGPDAARRCG